MIIRDGRYERLRHAVATMLRLSEEARDTAASSVHPESIEWAAAEDDADEWALLLHELDAAAPPELRAIVLGE